jgi:hypothetical protein
MTNKTSDPIAQLVIDAIEDFPFNEDYRQELIQAFLEERTTTEQKECCHIAVEKYWKD